MHTSAAALELDFTEPSITAANAVFAELRKGDSVDRPGLLRTMETAYGSIAADGHWSLRDAYDVLELGQVLHLATLDMPQEPTECLAALTALTASVPTHTIRSEEQITLQHFSTPDAIAYPRWPIAPPPRKIAIWIAGYAFRTMPTLLSGD